MFVRPEVVVGAVEARAEDVAGAGAVKGRAEDTQTSVQHNRLHHHCHRHPAWRTSSVPRSVVCSMVSLSRVW